MRLCRWELEGRREGGVLSRYRGVYGGRKAGVEEGGSAGRRRGDGGAPQGEGKVKLIS